MARGALHRSRLPARVLSPLSRLQIILPGLVVGALSRAEAAQRHHRSARHLTPPPMKIGIVTGMRSEAAIARRFGALVAVTGGRAARAEEAARGLVDQGATLLLSFGIAGGLAPGLVSGALGLADRVILPDGAIDSDAAWRARRRGVLRGAQVGAGMGEDRIAQRAAAQAALFGRHGALAVGLGS